MCRNGKHVCEFTRIVMIIISALAIVGNAKADFVFGKPASMGPTLNGAGGNYGPCISADALEVYLHRDPGEIWVAHRATPEDEWTPPSNLGPVVNSPNYDGGPCLSGEGLSLYFFSDRPTGHGADDIYLATRPTTGDDWGTPVNLGATVNSAFGEYAPCVSTNGLELYFTSERPAGSGNGDLWMASRATVDDDWGTPVNLGSTLNSPQHDNWPGISPDGLLLFFGSNRSGGTGSFDLYMAKRATTEDSWGPPVNLGPAVNSTTWETGPKVSPDGSMLCFQSPRPGGFSSCDMWQAPILRIVDFNGDGTVDSEDKAILMDHWGQDGSLCDIGPMSWGDGIVDSQDLRVLAEYVDVDDVVMVHTPSVHAADVSLDVTLRWLPAEIADTHDVYFGTSFADVYAANRDDPRDVLVSQDQSANEFDPGQLAFGQTYYWRIDEVTATFEPTIYRGVVVDFTTESLAYPLENVSATASTSDAGAGPENTVNGSGLNDEGEHATAATDMWLASGNGVDPVWIQYEFDKVYKLHEMLIWNYNGMFELVLGFGLKDVTVEYSENGADWIVLGDVELAQATATATYTANTTIDFGGVAAKYVRLTVTNGWGMMGKFGLSEVRFLYIPARAREPQPVNGAIGVSLDTSLEWRPGREAVAHEIYLSTDRQAVIDGTAPVDTVTESGYLSGFLDPGQTYYWKVNEIDAAEATGVWEGDVWKFTTGE